MKTAVSIPDNLFHAAEREAKRRGVSRSKLIQTALEDMMRVVQSAAITEALNQSYSASPNDGDPFMHRLTTETMKRAEWADETGGNLVGRRRHAKRVGTRVSKARRNRIGK